jgi:hypothetical protein
MPRDPSTGGLISSIVAVALCVKPRGMLTKSQKAKVAVLKSSLPSFAVIRALAMRFRGMMKSSKADGLDAWLVRSRLRHLWHAGLRPSAAEGFGRCSEQR